MYVFVCLYVMRTKGETVCVREMGDETSSEENEVDDNDDGEEDERGCLMISSSICVGC